MNKVELLVESSTKTKNDNFCNKLVNKSIIEIDTDFGKVSQERTSTYYLFTEKENEKGMKASLDLELFDIIEKEYPFVDDEGAEQVATLKYLYPKR
jgi:hypothetical protein